MMTSSETIYSHKYDVSDERSCDVTPLVDLLSRLERVAVFFFTFRLFVLFYWPVQYRKLQLTFPSGYRPIYL